VVKNSIEARRKLHAKGGEGTVEWKNKGEKKLKKFLDNLDDDMQSIPSDEELERMYKPKIIEDIDDEGISSTAEQDDHTTPFELEQMQGRDDGVAEIASKHSHPNYSSDSYLLPSDCPYADDIAGVLLIVVVVCFYCFLGYKITVFSLVLYFPLKVLECFLLKCAPLLFLLVSCSHLRVVLSNVCVQWRQKCLKFLGLSLGIWYIYILISKIVN
jgi:hypothetical protein